MTDKCRYVNCTLDAPERKRYCLEHEKKVLEEIDIRFKRQEYIDKMVTFTIDRLISAGFIKETKGLGETHKSILAKLLEE